MPWRYLKNNLGNKKQFYCTELGDQCSIPAECVAVTNITYFLFVCWNVGDAWPCLFMIY